jgi:rhodanese-related sulfurtransferase
MNKFLDYSELPRILLEAVVILCFSILIGLSIHFQLVRDVLTGKLAVPAAIRPTDSDAVPASYPEPVDLQTVQNQATTGALLIDARIEELFLEGHLPGSVSLPLDEIDSRLPEFHKLYPPHTPVIVYCSGYGCSDSFDLAVRLLQAGYLKVMVFEGGYPEWQAAGLPIEGSD